VAQRVELRQRPAGRRGDGQPDFISFISNQDSIDGTPTAATLSFPLGIAVDFKDNLYVADEFNARVLEYDTPFTVSSERRERVRSQAESGDRAEISPDKIAIRAGAAPRRSAIPKRSRSIRRITYMSRIPAMAAYWNLRTTRSAGSHRQPPQRYSALTAPAPTSRAQADARRRATSRCARRRDWRWTAKATCTSPIPATTASWFSIRRSMDPAARRAPEM
jgi:hypothetical protein